MKTTLETPSKVKSVRNGISAYQFVDGTVVINGQQYVGISLSQAIIKYRREFPKYGRKRKSLHLTLENAISVQDMNLSEWKIVLKPEIFEKLLKIVKNKNKGVTNPHNICRGEMLSKIVYDVAAGLEFLYYEETIVNFSLKIKTDKSFDDIEKVLRKAVFQELDKNHIATPANVKVAYINVG